MDLPKQFYMKYTGMYVRGVFTPDEGMKANYGVFKRRLEANQQRVTITIKEATKDSSESQVGLFWVVVNMIVDATGSSAEQVLIYSLRFRPRIIPTNVQKKDMGEMNTKEMSEFIDKFIMGANEDFNLNLQAEVLANGVTKIVNDRT